MDVERGAIRGTKGPVEGLFNLVELSWTISKVSRCASVIGYQIAQVYISFKDKRDAEELMGTA